MAIIFLLDSGILIAQFAYVFIDHKQESVHSAALVLSLLDWIHKKGKFFFFSPWYVFYIKREQIKNVIKWNNDKDKKEGSLCLILNYNCCNYSGEKIVSSISGVEKTGQLHVKRMKSETP